MKIPPFIFLLAFLFSCATTDEKPTPPNIVLLFADDLGYGDLGAYGHPTIRTPNLDGLVAKGVKFTNFYSGSPACTASRYALLTGRYPVHSGFDWVLYPYSSKGIHPNEITLAEGLKEMGYATGAFGKWHLGTTKKDYLPLQNGFDEYLGLPYSNDMIPPVHPDIPLLDGNDTLELNPDQSTLTRRYTERAISFIKKNKKGPFFCYLPYAMPHVPLHPGKDFEGTSARGKYGDVVEEIDWSVGEIMNTLEANGLAENTLVFFTSDNGPWIIKNEEGGSAGLLRDGKGSTWEGGMREPAIAYMKGKTPASSVVQSPVSTLDLYASFLKMGGYSFAENHHLNGRDISGLFFVKNAKAVDEQPYFFYGTGHLHAVRKGAWKLHVRTSSQTGKDYFNGKLPLLFNLAVDPSEAYDLSEKHPEKVAELQAEIDRQNDYVKAHPDFFQQEREKEKLIHLALDKQVVLKTPPHPNYPNTEALTDGFLEKTDAFKRLPGFEGTNFEAVLDLGKITEVHELTVGFLQVPRSWVFLPSDIFFYTSTDGKQFEAVRHFTTEKPGNTAKEQVMYFTQNNITLTTRYIKVTAQNRPCPEWHENAGQSCWLFVDEIVVK